MLFRFRSGDWKDKNAYTYGLHGTPTTFTLEARLAEIEGGSHCLLAPSGLAAISMVDLALLKSGDDRVAQILHLWSDPSVAPIEKADTKAASGVWPGLK